jgi:hypothetical protein
LSKPFTWQKTGSVAGIDPEKNVFAMHNNNATLQKYDKPFVFLIIFSLYQVF